MVRLSSAAFPGISYSTLFGGPEADMGHGIALDTATDEVYITGRTETPSGNGFGLVGQRISPNVVLGEERFARAFVAKFNDAGNPHLGNQVFYFAYLSGDGTDVGNGIAVTPESNVKLWVTGSTSSRTFPDKNALRDKYGGLTDTFLAYLDPSIINQNTLLFSTYIGGSEQDRGNAVGVTSNNAAIVAGYTSSRNFRAPRQPAIPGFQKVYGGGNSMDAFVLRVDPTPMNREAGILNPIPNQGVMVGNQLTFTASATTDNGSAPNYFIEGAPPPFFTYGPTMDPVTGVFTWTPTQYLDPPNVVFYTFFVQSADSDGRYDEQAITVGVGQPDRPSYLDAPGDNVSEAASIVHYPGATTRINDMVGNGQYPSKDVDLYGVSLQAGQKLTVDIDAQVVPGGSPLSGLDSYLRLFDSNFTQIAWNNDGIDPETGTTSQDSILTYTATSDVRILLGVSGNSNTNYNPLLAGSGVVGSTGNYLLKVRVDSNTFTEISLSSSSNPSASGQPVTFAATVTSEGGSPTGTVDFYADGQLLGSATLNSAGQAQLTTANLAVGGHNIVAVYRGDSIFRACTSGTIGQDITP